MKTRPDNNGAASPVRGRSCDRHGFHPQLPFLQRHAPRLHPCQYSTRSASRRSCSFRQPLAAASLLNRLQAAAEVPLLVTADFETGFRMAGVTNFPRAMAFGAAGAPVLRRRLLARRQPAWWNGFRTA